jgi:hypothetical protein
MSYSSKKSTPLFSGMKIYTFYDRSDKTVVSNVAVCAESLHEYGGKLWGISTKYKNAAGETVYYETIYSETRPSWVPAEFQ